MPIEYEMMVLKRLTEQAIVSYSEYFYLVNWYVNIEDKVLDIVLHEKDYAKDLFTVNQFNAMCELLRKGYWIKYGENGPVLVKRDLDIPYFSDKLPIKHGAD